ncbi:MAG: tRNA (adenosine(37)-N6)-threonylcarbamoyltransferase complex ATPase subunit type 1 TsaE [Anaerolineales bacterium]|nr:tRNA (adenosine(37)-N6)-threonylcarbamoyltransferase complex ATPase subunit type 1 TsaE [Anaerolineales bacterium]
MPILDPHSMEFFSRSAEQTRRVGMRLGGLLKIGDVVGLIGELGSGKTTLVQGMAAGWGSLDPVSSPTYVLVNVYRQLDGKRLYHLDAYRLGSALEAIDLDLDFMLATGPLVVEWAERVQEALPDEGLKVTLAYIDDVRRNLTFSAQGRRFEMMLKALRQQLWSKT